VKSCRIAFYAPMKAPDHPVPSGDRRIGRLLMDALGQIPGVTVDLACHLRSRDPSGAKAARFEALGRRAANALLRRYSAHPETRPDLWFTYHLYYKAPDWIGPRVAAALGIPYVVAEASLTSKHRTGAFAPASAAVAAALQGAAASLSLNPVDAAALARLVSGLKQVPLTPFLDLTPYRAAAAAREAARTDLAARVGLSPAEPWLLAVGMMRAGDKEASFRLLAEALRPLQDRPWSLLLVGDGPKRRDLEAAFAPFGNRVHWLGALPETALPPVYAACDWLVWPAINEAIGMALLEAQAAGLPVIAGATGAIPTLIAEGETGFLAPVGDVAAFTDRLRGALVTASAPFRMAALALTAAHHGLPAASARLAELLTDLGVR
jgi:glycosyltransferase involved in cell wall biosynthesis